MKRKIPWRRLYISMLAGMAAAVLAVREPAPRTVAECWWGVMYPEFCFAQGGIPMEEKLPAGEEKQDPERHFSFYFLK